MSQLLKKSALLAVCAALALCFATQSAQAQMVASGGTGEHLFFAYWSTANYTNTNVNIHSPLGVRTGAAQRKNVVYVRVRSTAPDRNVVASFNICLMAGDSWTATLSSEGLMVGDPGECDGDVRAIGSNPGNMNVATPAMGEMVSLGATDSGYIEAWLNPRNALMDDTSFVKAPDADFSPEDAQPHAISGTAMLVSPMSGFSSSYNAVALDRCGNRIAADSEVSRMVAESLAAGSGSVRNTATTEDTDDRAGAGDDGNGCWHVLQDDPGTPASEADAAGAVINAALMMGDTKDLLTGRWTAIDDENVMSNTKVVLTFPLNHLNYANGTSDPVSLFVFDDMGNIVLSSIGLTLSSNGEEVGALDAVSGEFRIFNNTAPAMAARVGEIPDNVTPAASFDAIGLVFSYFEGTDGSQYDQVTSLQWIDVDRDGNNPDETPGVEDDVAEEFTDTGADL